MSTTKRPLYAKYESFEVIQVHLTARGEVVAFCKPLMGIVRHRNRYLAGTIYIDEHADMVDIKLLIAIWSDHLMGDNGESRARMANCL